MEKVKKNKKKILFSIIGVILISSIFSYIFMPQVKTFIGGSDSKAIVEDNNGNQYATDIGNIITENGKTYLIAPNRNRIELIFQKTLGNKRFRILNETTEVFGADHFGNLQFVGNLTANYTAQGNGYGFFANIGSSVKRIIMGKFNDIDVLNTVNASNFNASNDIQVAGTNVKQWLYNQTLSTYNSINTTISQWNTTAGAYTLKVNASAAAYTLAVNNSMAVAARYAYNSSLVPANVVGYGNWTGNSTALWTRSGIQQVGIGTTTPGADLEISGSFSGIGSVFQSTSTYSTFDASGDIISSRSDVNARNVKLDSNWIYGNYYTMNVFGNTSTTGRIQAFLLRPYMQGNGSIDTLAGFVTDPYFRGADAKGNVTNMIGAYMAAGSFGGGAVGNITNWKQLQIDSPGGTGNISNKYGIYIDAISNTKGTEHGIYSVGGNNYFANISIGVDNAGYLLTVGNSAKAMNISGGLYANSSSVGVGTSNPIETLTIGYGNIGMPSYNWHIQTSGDANWGFGVFNSGSVYFTEAKFSGVGDANRGFRVSDIGAGTTPLSVDGQGRTLLSGPITTGTTTAQAWNHFGSGTKDNANVADSNDVYISDDLEVDGTAYYGSTTWTIGDIAENIDTKASRKNSVCNGDVSCYINKTKENLNYGDLVCIDPTEGHTIMKCSEANSKLAVGFISESARIMVGPNGGYPISLAGIVNAHVTNENGNVNPGDLLVSSSKAGYVMKSDNPKDGTVVGKAFDFCDKPDCKIKVFVALS